MKKFTVLFITILAVGFLGSTQAGSQNNGKYMLDDTGYKLIEADGQGQVTTRIVENKDVPWHIRFNPSSNLAGIWDNRTSLLRRLKKAAFLASLGAVSMLGSYRLGAFRKKIALGNEEINKIREKWEERKKRRDLFIGAGLLPATGLGTAYMMAYQAASTFAYSELSAHPGAILQAIGAFSSDITFALSVLLYVPSSQLATFSLAKIFSKSMVKRTQHLDRNLQLNVVEAAF